MKNYLKKNNLKKNRNSINLILLIPYGKSVFTYCTVRFPHF